MYEYQCEIIRVIDGDTVDVRVDLGFSISQEMKIRLAGVNAPELGTPEGVEARNWLLAATPIGSTWKLQTIKDRKEKYGRYLGYLFAFGETFANSINKQLIDAGHAVAKDYR